MNIQTASPENVEIAGACGSDFVLIDAEHGSMQLDRIVEMLRAADAIGTTALVRVPDHTPSFIGRALDAGAMGVVVPNVSNATQARRVVAAARFASDGGDTPSRGACPSTRAAWHLTEQWSEFARWSDETTMVWVLIEKRCALSEIDEIVKVPGLSAIVPGPFDLAQSMGLGGDLRHPELQQALRRISAAARAQGLDVVAPLLSSELPALEQETAFWREAGASIFWAGSDRRLLAVAMRRRRAAVEQCIEPLRESDNE
ncbi:MAG: aldolase [Burkholderiales bacterium]|nr:aldolase [Burkholderiales bacterium]